MGEPSAVVLLKASTADVDLAVAIVREASDWLAQQGFEWLRRFPGATPQRVEEGKVWLAYLDGIAEPVATVALETNADPEWWGDQETDALFVHGLAVRREAGGLSLGSRLLDFAGDQAARRSLPWIRLDCHKSNGQLQEYYRRNGFTHLRTVDLPHRKSGALFQRQAQQSPAVHACEDQDGRFVIDLPTS
jgi:ribosomal protein S18 acetylase RimI-like enzyme